MRHCDDRQINNVNSSKSTRILICKWKKPNPSITRLNTSIELHCSRYFVRISHFNEY